MASTLVPKSTLEQAEIPSNQLIRFGILIGNNVDLRQDFPKKIQYINNINVTCNEYVKNITEKLRKENIFDVEITQEIIKFDEHTIMEKICTWCDKSEVDIIFIIDFPHSPPERLDYYPGAIKEMLTKTFENIVDKHGFKKYAASGPKIKEKLESEYNRVMCGERNEKLIINLFGMCESTINCLNIIKTTLNDELTFYVEHNQKVKQDIISCSIDSSSDQIKLEDITSNTQYDMVPFTEAISIIHKEAKNGANNNSHKINIKKAFGRILCEHVYSKCNVPAFRVSTKHGYAVLASDNEGMRIVLNKTTFVQYRSDPISLSPGTCMWVKSGDRVPDEATAVVKVEDAKRIVNHKTTQDFILIMIKPEFGQNIKNVGSDIPKGELIMSPFTRIGPAELGLLAATGCNEVDVVTPLFVGVLLIDDSKSRDPSKKKYFTYDSSHISLLALLDEIGSMLNRRYDLRSVPEDLESIKKRIDAALIIVKVLVIIGCVNDHDVLKTILRDYLGASIHFGSVNIKPGKSTTFATCEVNGETKYILCLSRNPVSSLTSAQLFLIPLLNEICQRKYNHRKVIKARINQQYILHPRPRIVWSNLRWNLEKKKFPEPLCTENLVNDNLFSSQGANALLMLPGQKVDCKMITPAFVPALSLDPN